MKKNTSKAEDDKLFTVTKSEPVNPTWLVILSTLVCSAFLIVGALASLSLRGDIKLPNNFNETLGNSLLTFVVAAMFTLVYKANKR